MTTIKNATVSLRELMLDEEISSYNHSKYLTHLYNSKRKNLNMIGIKMLDSTAKKAKAEIKLYKAMIEKQKFLCEYLYN